MSENTIVRRRRHASFLLDAIQTYAINYLASASDITSQYMLALLQPLNPTLIVRDDIQLPRLSIVYTEYATYKIRLLIQIPKTTYDYTIQFLSDVPELNVSSETLLDRVKEQEVFEDVKYKLIKLLIEPIALLELLMLVGLLKKTVSWKPFVLERIKRAVLGDKNLSERIQEIANKVLQGQPIEQFLSIHDYLLDKRFLDTVILADEISHSMKTVSQAELDYIQKQIMFGAIERLIRDSYAWIILKYGQLLTNHNLQPIVDYDYILSALELDTLYSNEKPFGKIIEGSVSYLDFANEFIERLPELPFSGSDSHKPDNKQNPQNQQQQQTSSCSGGSCALGNNMNQQGQSSCCQNTAQNQQNTGGQNTNQNSSGDMNGITTENLSIDNVPLSDISDILEYYMQSFEAVIQANPHESNTEANIDQESSIAQTIKVLEQYMEQKTRGLGSLQQITEIGNPLEFDISFLKKLRTYTLETIFTDRRRNVPTYTDVNRLLLDYTRKSGIIMPALKDKMREYHFIVTIDESGSMSNEELRYINYLLREANKLGYVYLIKHDYEVVYEEVFKPKDYRIKELVKQRHSCGGTSHEQVFEHILAYYRKNKLLKRNSNSKAVIIICSDFYSDLSAVLAKADVRDIVLDPKTYVVCVAPTRSEEQIAKKEVEQGLGTIPKNFKFVVIRENMKASGDA